MTVVVEKDPFRICVYDQEKTLLHADIVDLAYQEDSNRRRIHTSEISPDDCFYGFGEKSGEFNKAQKFMNMSPKDAMGYNPKETDSLYKHIPFYIKLNRRTKKAVGYFYHNTWECDFDMGREKSNYWKMHSRYRADGGDVDLFLIAGPCVGEVVERYTDLTGKSALLPRTALGYLGSSMYYPELEADCDRAIVEFIDTTKEENIPVDGFQLSSGYCTVESEVGVKRCVFTWNKKRFKDPHHRDPEREAGNPPAPPDAGGNEGERDVREGQQKRRAGSRHLVGRQGRVRRLHERGDEGELEGVTQGARARLRHEFRVERQLRVRQHGRQRLPRVF